MVNGKERIEVERIINLVTGFGWVKEKEELSDTEIKITLSKKRRVPETPGIPE
ncbi:hypothetical protein ES702_05053 [subsurface metagenome]